MSVKEAVKSKDTSNSVPRAVIEMEEPNSFHMPTEFFVKKLVNGPFEFGTVTISEHVSGGVEEGEIHYENYEIDIAMHPNLGLVVCGVFLLRRRTKLRWCWRTWRCSGRSW